MKPINFKGTNTIFDVPEDIKQHVEPIQAFTGTMYDERIAAVVSCHELDSDELMRVIETKRVYLTTLGVGRAPVLITVANPVEEGWVR